mmetsp:Transcript_44744/g.130260  ORF Transcript_44744/g.130260 Transcript_44744/m.130260 type:complete len:419 (+) Transcript_44744:816-2072(+)
MGSSMSSRSSCKLFTFFSAASRNLTKSPAEICPSPSASTASKSCSALRARSLWLCLMIFITATWNFSCSPSRFLLADSRNRFDNPVAFTKRDSISFIRCDTGAASLANVPVNTSSASTSLRIVSTSRAVASMTDLASAMTPSVLSANLSIWGTRKVFTLPTSRKICRSTLTALFAAFSTAAEAAVSLSFIVARLRSRSSRFRTSRSRSRAMPKAALRNTKSCTCTPREPSVTMVSAMTSSTLSGTVKENSFCAYLAISFLDSMSSFVSLYLPKTALISLCRSLAAARRRAFSFAALAAWKVESDSCAQTEIRRRSSATNSWISEASACCGAGSFMSLAFWATKSLHAFVRMLDSTTPSSITCEISSTSPTLNSEESSKKAADSLNFTTADSAAPTRPSSSRHSFITSSRCPSIFRFCS